MKENERKRKGKKKEKEKVKEKEKTKTRMKKGKEGPLGYPSRRHRFDPSEGDSKSEPPITFEVENATQRGRASVWG